MSDQTSDVVGALEVGDIREALTSADAIKTATDNVVTARVLQTMANDMRKGKPLIQIKGLGEAVASARKDISSVRTEIGGLSVDAAKLVAALQDVRAQIGQAHDDLRFEAETLGNGGETQSGVTSGSAGT